VAGHRIDAALSALAGVPRAQVQRWIEARCVRVGGAAVTRAGRRLADGDVVEADPPAPVAAAVVAEDLPLRVVYEDEDLIVIDKAAGMVVHPAPGHPRGTLVNALLHHCGDLAGIGGILRPGIVHRLDQGTSGIMVAAKHDAAHLALARQFHDHTIERLYIAWARSVPAADEGLVDRPIGRHRRDRKRMSVRSRAGKPARTRWRVIARYPASVQACLEIRPETGRTHQIRVHLASVGLPLAGDPVYGAGGRDARRAAAELTRPALHAARLGFDHPRGGRRLVFEAPLPEDLIAHRIWLEAREAER
jgi:23S rRNA pseudouridine1911/1915/1917 synthase